MGGEGAEGHPQIAGYDSSSCLLFGNEARGEAATTTGEILYSSHQIFYPHLDVCPVLPSSEGGQMSDLLPGGLEFTGTRLSSEHLASDPASCFSNNVG